MDEKPGYLPVHPTGEVEATESEMERSQRGQALRHSRKMTRRPPAGGVDNALPASGLAAVPPPPVTLSEYKWVNFRGRRGASCRNVRRQFIRAMGPGRVGNGIWAGELFHRVSEGQRAMVGVGEGLSAGLHESERAAQARFLGHDFAERPRGAQAIRARNANPER